MLLDLDRINLEMVRGDTFKLNLPLNCGTREYPKRYILGPNDAVFIGIMKPGQSFEHADIRCMLTHNDYVNNDLILTLNSSNTVNMYPGKYYMTVKFVSNGEVQTLVDQKQFFITGSDPCC